MSSSFDPDQPVSWRAVPLGVPVRGSDGSTVGSLDGILASSEEDIFHGIVVGLSESKRNVFVPADAVTTLAIGHVDVDRTVADLALQPDYREEPAFRLGEKGLLRKHPDWIDEKNR